jgi:[protein-PII] uridylyltransferase
MSNAPSVPSERLSERLRQQRARLQSLRDQARLRYSGGAPGLQVATLICEWTDELIIEIFGHALQSLDETARRRAAGCAAIVATGGTARGELAPFSDADLLFLRTSACPREFDECIAQAVRDCWDAGIRLGHSVHTPAAALAAARGDTTFATALVGARRLWGDERLFESFRARFQRRIVRNRYARFYHDCVAAREAERKQFGLSERQLEPDVKRSSGGLRDIHLLRWIGYAAYGTGDIDLLRRQGALTKEDADALREAHEFLTRIRVDLHFAAGKAQETLTREEQLRLADLHGVVATASQRPVERFMQTYFRHATAVADISARFVVRHRPRSLWHRCVQFLLSHRSNQVFRVSGGEIDVVPRHRERVCGSLESLLNLHELAALYSARLTPELADQIRQSVPRLPREVSPQAARLFLSILRATGQVGRQLRSMFATGLLDVILPEITHVRCLLQFNQYHCYTVDEHSLRAVEAAENLDGDPGPFGTAYRKIRHKELLHLALLLHDLGKGFEHDHCEIGREIAETVATRLGLPAPQRETLMFLVHKHLLMEQIAFRRDLTDLELLTRVSRDVGSPESLRMLYVLTASDMTAVGPRAWTGWKADLVTELFERTLQILSGEPSMYREAERVQQVCRQVQSSLVENPALVGNGGGDPFPSTGEPDASLPEVEQQLRSLPTHYLIATPSGEIVDDLACVRRIAAGDDTVLVRGTYDPLSHTTEYRVITRDQTGSRLFSNLTGVLTAKGLEILSANICTTSEGIVIDRFRVHDTDYAPPIPHFRLEEIESAITAVLEGRQSVEALFQRHRRILLRAESQLLIREPSRVAIDNNSSERFTIVDVFADDRRGLLYTIARALLELNVSVALAKISTHVDQVLDVFYVTDRDGGKLQDEQRLESIRGTLVARIEEFERHGLSPTDLSG